MTGWLELIIGPMMASKSTHLIALYKKIKDEGKHCALVTFSGDTRSSKGCIETHRGERLEADFVTFYVKDIFPNLLGYKYIFFDEGQFYPDLADYAHVLANAGKIVYVFGLSCTGTFERTGFKTIQKLVSRADMIVKLSARCSLCNSHAPFFRRTVPTDEQMMEMGEYNPALIGGAECYSPICRTCWTGLRFVKDSSSSSSSLPL